ncbi:MAG: proprotein convertase P-domain-containing protein [Phycisphaeraceae bacterium]|nr:proprotein convertase P-domain-containing protein [Phycisphaeraceae bacterium]
MKMRALALATIAGLAMTTGAMASGEYNNGFGNAVAIPDADPTGATLTLNVPSDAVNGDIISSLNVGIAITHSWQGDLLVSLTSPTGQSIYLLAFAGVGVDDDYGFSADNFGDKIDASYMIFSDLGTSVYDAPDIAYPGIANASGTFLAYEGSLNDAFGGVNASGVWTLTVADYVGGDTGMIDGFSLNMTTVPAPGSVALLGVSGLLVARRRR